MLLDALHNVAPYGVRFAFHAENEHGIQRQKESGRTERLAHVDSRPIICELAAIQRMRMNPPVCY